MIKGKNFLLLLFLISSCSTFNVYFNTFYNAKKYYKDAERKYFKNKRKLSQDIRSLYEKALEKYLRIVKFFPNSPFFDDALFYSGMIYIRLEDKKNSIKKYEEISRYFPKSPFVHMLSDSLLNFLLEKKDIENSFYVLTVYPKKESDNFLFYKARYFSLVDETDSSLYYSKTIIKKNSYLKDNVLPIYVESALKKGQVDSALYYLENTKEKSGRLSLLLAKAYKEKGDFEKAVRVILEFDPENKDFEAVKLLTEVYEEMRDTMNLKRIIRNYMKKGEDPFKKQELAYKLALILYKEDSLEALKKILSEIKKFSPSTEYGYKASSWLKLIDREEKLKDKKGEELERELLKIAESYYLEIGLYEKSVFLLDEFIKKFSESNEKPRAIYLIIFIYKKFLKNEGKMKKYFEILEKEYKESLYYELARNLLKEN